MSFGVRFFFPRNLGEFKQMKNSVRLVVDRKAWHATLEVGL